MKNFFKLGMDLSISLCYIIFVANNGVWLSLVERFVRDEEVACSNLVTPTIIKPLEPLCFKGFFLFVFLCNVVARTAVSLHLVQR